MRLEPAICSSASFGSTITLIIFICSGTFILTPIVVLQSRTQRVFFRMVESRRIDITQGVIVDVRI